MPGVGAGRAPSLCLRAYGEQRWRTPEREAGKEAKSGRRGMRTEKGRDREHPNQGKAHGRPASGNANLADLEKINAEK